MSLSLTACEKPEQTTKDSVAAVAEQKAESARLNEWFEAKYEEEIMMSPIGLTFLGRKERYGEIDDLSVAAQDKQLEWKRQSVEEMTSSFDYAKLTDDAKLSYDLWKYQYEEAAADVPFRGNGYVFTQMQGVHSFLATLMVSFHKVESASDMEAYIKRIAGISTGIKTLLQRAKQNAEYGVRPPKFTYEGVIEQAENLVTGKPFSKSEQDSPLWTDAKSKIASLLNVETIDQAQAEDLTKRAHHALLGQNNFFGSVVQSYHNS